MEVFVETTPIISDKTKSHAWTALQVLLGSLFLAACAQITIPLYPVPLTMQTFGIFLLAIMQGGKKACMSTLLYLGLVTAGLPVLAGWHSEAIWWALPSVGFIAAFPIAAFAIGKMVEMRKKHSAIWVMTSIVTGQVIIYTLGVLGLMRILSFEQSLAAGLIPFVPLAGVKLLLATSFSGLWLRWKRK